MVKGKHCKEKSFGQAFQQFFAANKGIKIAALVCIVMLLVGTTFAWFSSNITLVNGKLELGTLKIKTTIYDMDGWTVVSQINEDGNQQVDEASGIVCANGIANMYRSIRYIKVENAGTLDARLFLHVLGGEALEKLAQYDKGYFYLNVTDISDLVQTNANGLKGYAQNYQGNTITEIDASSKIRSSYRLNQLVQRSMVLGSGKDRILEVGKTGYYKVEFFCYNLPSEVLEKVNGESITIDAQITAKQSNAPWNDDDDDVGVVNNVSDLEAFILAVQTASNGDTIILNSDISVTENYNVTFYHRVNLYLNGHDLTIKGNLVYDHAEAGNCVLNVEGGSKLSVNGDLIVDTPNASFELVGGGVANVVVGTTEYDGRFEVNCVRDEYDVNAGYQQRNVGVVGAGGVTKSLTVYGHTAVTIGQNSQIGSIVAAPGAVNISVVNKGTIKDVDFSRMSYWKLDKPEQIFFENANTITNPEMAVKLPSWSRGHISSLDPNDPSKNNYQVNTTLSKDAGAVTADWHCGVVYSGAEYSAYDRETFLAAHPETDEEFLNKINFWDVDILYSDMADTPVTREKEGYYTVRMYDSNPDNPDKLAKLMDEFFKIPENSDYRMETIQSMTIRTYGSASLDPDDFVFLRSGDQSANISVNLTALDLSGAAVVNNTIPESAMSGCGNLQYLSLPITDVSIGKNAFLNCNIEELTLSTNVKSVGGDAFKRKNGGKVYVTWDAGIQIPVSVLQGFGTSYTRLFMDEQFAETIDNVKNGWAAYTYERYSFIERSTRTFIKTMGVSNARIVLYEGDFKEDGMILDSYNNGSREYLTYSIGLRAYRLVGDNQSKYVNLIFPATCREIRRAAFYQTYHISELALNNVEYIGDYAFYNAYIRHSSKRPETFTGMTNVGANAFYNVKFSPIEDPTQITNTVLEGYAASGDANAPYVAGVLDLSAAPGAGIRLPRYALFGMNVGAGILKLEDYGMIGDSADATVDRNDDAGVAFYGAWVSTNGAGGIGEYSFNGAFKQSCSEYNRVDVRNVKAFGYGVFYRCYLNLIEAGVDDPAYTSQADVDRDFNWNASISNNGPAFNGSRVNELDFTGYMPMSGARRSAFAAQQETHYKKVRIHDLHPDSRITNQLLVYTRVDEILVESNYDLTVGTSAFQQIQSTAGDKTAVTLNVGGQLSVESYGFYASKIKDFARYSLENDQWVHKNYIESAADYAFTDVLSAPASMKDGMPMDFTRCTFVGTWAFSNCDAAVGRYLVLPDSLSAVSKDAFAYNDMITVKANGISGLYTETESVFYGCKLLVSLEAKGLLTLPGYAIRSDSSKWAYNLQRLVLGDLYSSVADQFLRSFSDSTFDMVIQVPGDDQRLLWRNRYANRVSNCMTDAYVEAYDLDHYSKQQFMLLGEQLPQYILAPNDDGTYRITEVRNYYWDADEAEVKSQEIPASDVVSEFITTKPYESLTVPDTLYDLDGTPYTISGMDNQAMNNCKVNGRLEFSAGLKTFGYDDSFAAFNMPTDVSSSILRYYAGNLTELVFLGGGAFSEEPDVDGSVNRMTFGKYAFYNVTYSNLTNLQLNRADIGYVGFYSNTFPALETVRLCGLTVTGRNSISNYYTGAIVYDLYNSKINTTSNDNTGTYWQSFGQPVVYTWKNVTATSLGNMFWDSGNVSTIKKMVLDGVKFEGSAVNYCGGNARNFAGLEELVIKDCHGTQRVPNLFSHCNADLTSLKSITIENSYVGDLSKNKPALEFITVKGSTVGAIYGDKDMLKEILVENSTIGDISGNKPILDSLVLKNTTVNAFSGNTGSEDALKTLELTGCTVKGFTANVTTTEDCNLLLKDCTVTSMAGTIKGPLKSITMEGCSIAGFSTTMETAGDFLLKDCTVTSMAGSIKGPLSSITMEGGSIAGFSTIMETAGDFLATGTTFNGFTAAVDVRGDVVMDQCYFTSMAGTLNGDCTLTIQNSPRLDSFGTALPGVTELTIQNCNIGSWGLLSSRGMPKVTKILVDDCVQPTGYGEQALLRAINAPLCTEVTVKNVENLQIRSVSDMIVASNATVTLSGNSTFYSYNNVGDWRNNTRFYLENGTLDLRRQYSLQQNLIWGNIDTLILPDSSLPRDANAKDRTDGNFMGYSKDNYSASIFRHEKASYPANIGKVVYSEGGDLNLSIHLGYANIGELQFTKPITAIPYGFLYNGKLDKITWAEGQSTAENSIRHILWEGGSLSQQNEEATCLREDFTDMDPDVFTELFKRMDTTTSNVFFGATFPAGLTTLDLTEDSPFVLNIAFQYRSVTFPGVTELILPDVVDGKLKYCFYDTRWNELETLDMSGTDVQPFEFFESAKFYALKTLKLGTISTPSSSENYTFYNASFPELTELDFTQADIKKNATFRGATFSKLESLSIRGAAGSTQFYQAKLPALTSLQINQSSIGSSFFQEANMSALTSMDLTGISLGSATFYAANLSALENLTTGAGTSFANNSQIFSRTDLTSLADMTWNGITSMGYGNFLGAKVSEHAVWKFPDLPSMYGYRNFANMTVGSLELEFPVLTSCVPTKSDAKQDGSQFCDSTAIYKIDFGESMASVASITNSAMDPSVDFNYRAQEFRGMNATIIFRYPGVVTRYNTNPLVNAGNIKLLVPGNLVDTYKSSEYWSGISGQIYGNSMAAEEWIYRLTPGTDEVQILGYSGSQPSLYIPEIITTSDNKELKVVDIAADLLKGKSGVTSILLPAGIKHLDLELFDDTSLSSVGFYKGTPEAEVNYCTEGDFSNYMDKQTSIGVLLLSGDGKTLLRVMPAYTANTITVPESVISIADQAFKGSRANRVELTNVMAISGSAFEDSSLTHFQLDMGQPPLMLGDPFSILRSEEIVEGGASVVFSGAITVPGGSEEQYKKAPGFIGYSTIITGDPDLTPSAAAFALSLDNEAEEDTVYQDGSLRYRLETAEDGQIQSVLVGVSEDITEPVTITIPVRIGGFDAVFGENGEVLTPAFAGYPVVGIAPDFDTSLVSAFEAEPLSRFFTDEDGVLFTFDGENVVLVSFPAGSQLEKYVVREDAVIGDHAFAGAVNLKTVVIYSYSLRNMGAYAFADTSDELTVVAGYAAAVLYGNDLQDGVDVDTLKELLGLQGLSYDSGEEPYYEPEDTQPQDEVTEEVVEETEETPENTLEEVEETSEEIPENSEES